MRFNASPTWRATYPDAMIGVLTMNDLANPPRHDDLEARKVDLEGRLRQRYGSVDKAELRSHPVLRAYAAYYKKFDKSYHVQLQLESVIYKAKSIPSVAALVEAMFIAELEDMLLTAGHDLDAVQGDPSVEVADGTETYEMMNSQHQTLKAGDMYIHDDAGVLSSIIYGPASRARISPATHRALFTVYAPAGVDQEAVTSHLDRLKDLARIVHPQAGVEYEGVVR
jgi:DNA/RNA-binding domain of Phe-tRNA-synthetase-like protein